MGWLLMILINAIPFTILIDTESDCYQIGHKMVDYYKEQQGTFTAVCRKVYEI